jgi:glycine/D-amino acid oxidase-like deaminating enzyme
MSTQILAAYGERIARLEAENARLTEQLRIATETLNEIARCGCAACGPAPRDLAHARTLADDALTRMDTMG